MDPRTTHFASRLDELTQLVLRLGGLVEEAIGRSVHALVDRDSGTARKVLESDHAIDRLELEIDHLCLELLLLQQPMAGDLRFIATAMKINSDLERIGDHAVNISERALELNEAPPMPTFIDLPLMATRAQAMVRDALDAFVRRDAELAVATIARDRELNDQMRENFTRLADHAREQPQDIDQALRLSFVTKYFERIGDMAKNVCEQVVFMASGEVIKHQRVSRTGSGEDQS
ncbi:MAG: phosphate signaling complex protein PhoU [Acidobacteria bacterium]|uniref:Phosphate-specific transport system accessory protein PhoU n=1 Tax=Candidatus Polarisedimenticola svalbardensis TaxID=2886004 RepID=A0A8J7CF20_9BACT|nr:phosphate signaling complex protein PhoU [Candidatus Polarisedimenticola svalbardensis]